MTTQVLTPLLGPHLLITGLLMLVTAVASASATSAEAKARIRIEAPYIDLHSGPGRGYPITYSVAKGEVVEAQRQRTGWVKVTTRRDVRGWARATDLLPSSASRQPGDTHPPWQLGMALGDFSGARATSLYAGYQFSRHLSAGVIMTQAIGRFSDNQVARLQIKHTSLPLRRLSPYLLLSAGLARTSADATLVRSDDRLNSLLSLGFGAQYHLARNYIVSLEYINHTVLTSRNQNEEISEWKFGINAFF